MGKAKYFLLFATLALAGCGLQRQNVHLTVPSDNATTNDGKPVVIDSIKDERKPVCDVIPSAGFDSNVGGMCRGSGIGIYLDNGTVSDETKAIVTSALNDMGFQVVKSVDGSKPAIRMAIVVTKFDVTAPFDFWRTVAYIQKMYANISTDITLSENGSTRQFTVTGSDDNIYQLVTRDNWETALNRAILDYQKNLQIKMAASR